MGAQSIESMSETASLVVGTFHELSTESVKLLNTKQLDESIIQNILTVTGEFRKEIQSSYGNYSKEHLALCDAMERNIQKWKQTAMLLRYKAKWEESLEESLYCRFCRHTVVRGNLIKHLQKHAADLLKVKITADQVNAELGIKPKPVSVDLVSSDEVALPDPFQQVSDELPKKECKKRKTPPKSDPPKKKFKTPEFVDSSDDEKCKKILKRKLQFDDKKPEAPKKIKKKSAAPKRVQISKINNILDLMEKMENKQLNDSIKVVNLQRCFQKDADGKRTCHMYTYEEILETYQRFKQDREERAKQKRGKKPKKLSLPANMMQTCTILYHLEACILAQRTVAEEKNEIYNKYTRLSTTTIERLLIEIIQKESNLDKKLEIDNNFKIFILKCITCILFYLEKSLVILMTASKCNTIRPNELGTLFNITKELGNEIRRLPNEPFKYTNHLPTEDRILRVLYQCLYVSLDRRSETIEDILKRFIVDKEPAVCRIMKTKFSPATIKEFKYIIFRFFYAIADNIRNSPYYTDSQEDHLTLDIADFAKIYDSKYYDFQSFTNTIEMQLKLKKPASLPSDFVACWLKCN